MNKKIAWLSIICLFSALVEAKSQCNQHLVELAAEQAGADAIYIRDFKVKLSKGNSDNPSPTGKFPIFMNKGVRYRFNVANASDFEGKALMTVVRGGQKYVNNYSDNAGEYINYMDFWCPRSATYQLAINFGVRTEGCAAIVVSMIYQDSMDYIIPGIKTKSDSAESLYLWTDNKLQIASSEGKAANMVVSVSQGQVKKSGSYYYVRPKQTGPLVVSVHVFKKDRLIDSDSVWYEVEEPPLPRIVLPGQRGFEISRQEVSVFGQIGLESHFNTEYQPYSLKSFSISPNRNGFDTEFSNGNKLSTRQVELIKSREDNANIYILDALFMDPDGNIHKADQQELTVIR